MAEAENTPTQEDEWPTTWDEMKHEEACCGMLVSQIQHDWTCCPFCGSAFAPEIMDYQYFFGQERYA